MAPCSSFMILHRSLYFYTGTLTLGEPLQLLNELFMLQFGLSELTALLLHPLNLLYVK